MQRAYRAGMARAESRMVAPLAAGLVGLLALAVFVRTMAPTITLRHDGADSGDLVTAAINLGVPHPTGYPLYTMIAHLFAALPWGEPARSVALFSALAGALAAGVIFWAAYRLLVAQAGASWLVLIAAWTAAGLFGFGQLLWSQATIAEVYSLNALLVAALLAVALSGCRGARPYVLAFLFGLGLAHHLTIVFLVPALWPYLGSARRWLTLRRAVLGALCLLPGLLAYLYIPLRAAAHPVPNWGQASSSEGLLWLVTGAAYHRYLGGTPPTYLLQRFSAWAAIWVRDLGVPGLALALLGLWRGLETNQRLTLFALTYLALLTGYAMIYGTPDSYVYLLPAAEVVALWVAGGVLAAAQAAQDWVGPQRMHRGAVAVAVLLLAGLPLVSVAGRWQAMDLSADREAYALADGVLSASSPNAILISSGDAQTFPLWYLRYGLKVRPDVTVVDRNLLALDWYRRDLAAREPELAAVVDARDADGAATALVAVRPSGRPVQLAYADGLLLGLATWARQGALYTLVP